MITWVDIVIVCILLSVLAVTGMVVYAAARTKRRKMKHIESIFDDGALTPEEIRRAVEKDQKEHGEK